MEKVCRFTAQNLIKLPSGKHTQNDRKSPCVFNGEIHYFNGHFHHRLNRLVFRCDLPKIFAQPLMELYDVFIVNLVGGLQQVVFLTIHWECHTYFSEGFKPPISNEPLVNTFFR